MEQEFNLSQDKKITLGGIFPWEAATAIDHMFRRKGAIPDTLIEYDYEKNRFTFKAYMVESKRYEDCSVHGDAVWQIVKLFRAMNGGVKSPMRLPKKITPGGPSIVKMHRPGF